MKQNERQSRKQCGTGVGMKVYPIPDRGKKWRMWEGDGVMG